MTREADRKRISVVSRVRILYQRPGRGALRYDGRELPRAHENAALNHRRLMRGSFT
jgi:hypothetical protein